MNKCENCQRYYSGTCSKDLNKKECNYIEIEVKRIKHKKEPNQKRRRDKIKKIKR